MALFPPELVGNLIELLLLPDLQWGELYASCHDAPAARRLLDYLFGLSGGYGAFNVRLFGAAPNVNFLVSEECRTELLHSVFPYATLLDNRLTPFAQAQQLERHGVDLRAFCRGLIGENEPLYAEPARAALDAWNAHRSLLRHSQAPPDPAPELLRPVAGSEQTWDELLQPAAPASRSADRDTPPHSSFTQRLRGWLIGKPFRPNTRPTRRPDTETELEP